MLKTVSTSLAVCMMRRNVVNEKQFLKKVYKSRTPKTLEKADEKKLKALAFAVHLVITKKVPLTKRISKYFHKLKKSKVLSLKRVFGDKENLLSLLKSNKANQIRVIKRFLSLIKILLTSFFAPDTAIAAEQPEAIAS